MKKTIIDQVKQVQLAYKNFSIKLQALLWDYQNTSKENLKKVEDRKIKSLINKIKK